MNINFKTLNCDDEERTWSWSVEELEQNYWEGDDIPSLDDPVTYCEFAGKELYFGTFEDLVFTFLGATD